MIRPRIPEKDDRRLYALVVRRLIPFARQARPDVSFSRKEIIERLGNCRVLVACTEKGRSVGFISLKKADMTLTIDMLAVDRAYEGKGIGGALMSAAERYGRKHGMSMIQLAVDEPNTHAQRFYERKGFQVAQTLPEYRLIVLSKVL